MKFTSRNIFIFTLVSSLLIFSFIQLDISPKEKIIDPIIARLLSSRSFDEMMHDMCGKSSDDLESFYKDQEPIYDFQPEGKSQIINDLFIKLVNGSKSFELGKDEILGYLKENIFFIVIAVLLGLLIVLWIPFIICVSTKRCCCVSEGCSGNINVFLILTIIASGGVIFCSIIGYTKNTNILHGIFGLGCSILKMENHIVKGDEYNKVKPYWLGLSYIVDKLKLTEKEISKISGRYDDIYADLEETDGLFDKIKGELDEEWSDKQNKKISNPNKEGEMFTPNYIYYYGPTDNENTNLGLINSELSIYREYSINKLRDMINVINIKDKAGEISGSINKTTTEINKTVTNLENSIVNSISDYYDQFDEIDSIVRKIMNIFFSLNLALVIFFTVSIIILLCCKCGGVLICIAWFFIYIFLLVSVALGCALGIASSLVKDASFALKNVMNTIDNINIEKKDILDTCINGNGSLIFTKSIHFNFDSNIIDNIYKLESNISEGINSLQTLTFNSTKANGIHYNTILNKPKSQITELSEALKEIKKYINSEDENSKVDSSTPIYDTWEVNKEDCGEDYYPHQKSLRNLLEENEKKYRCLVITEWTIEEIQERYSAIKSKEEGIIISNIAKQYYNSINNFMKDNKDLINNIIDKNEEFDSSMNNIKESEIGILNNTREVITPLREIYNKAVDKGSIFGIMNCKFINRDLNKVVETLYKDIGGTFRSTSNIFLGIAGCELLITIFVLIIMKSLRANMTEIPDYSKYSKMVEK